MTKLQSNILLVVLSSLLIVLSLIALRSGRNGNDSQSAPDGSDAREAIVLNDEQLTYALAQMRGLLASVQQLDLALYESDFPAIAEIAAQEAPGSGRNPPRGLHDASPEGFNVMRKQMRQAFARMEQAASQSDPEAFHEAKQRALSACVACHESYRFVPE